MFYYYKNIIFCKHHIEIIMKIYEVFLKWSPAPTPIPGLVKQNCHEANTSKNKHALDDRHVFLFLNCKNGSNILFYV